MCGTKLQKHEKHFCSVKKNKNKNTTKQTYHSKQCKLCFSGGVGVSNTYTTTEHTPTPQKCESLLCLLAYHTFKKLKHANKSTCFTQVLFCRLALVMNSELNACPVWVVRRLQVSRTVNAIQWGELNLAHFHIAVLIYLQRSYSSTGPEVRAFFFFSKYVLVTLTRLMLWIINPFNTFS